MPMSHTLLLAGAVALVLTAATPAAADCMRTKVTLCDGCVAEQTLTITGHSPCRILQNFQAGIISTEVLIKPKHGVFAHSSATDHAYLPLPNFTGEDYFETETVYRRTTGGTSRAILHTKVIVVN